MPKPKGAMKTGGRRKGTPNRVTADLRARIKQMLDGADIEDAFEALDAREKVRLFATLAEFIVPKCTRIDQQIEEEIATLKKQLNELLTDSNHHDHERKEPLS